MPGEPASQRRPTVPSLFSATVSITAPNPEAENQQERKEVTHAAGRSTRPEVDLPPPPVKRRGQTVVEALVCMALLGFLMVLMFAVYRMGSNASKKGSTQTELVQDLPARSSRVRTATGYAD